ncbi:putative phage baseplate assembly protein [Tumebacillus sp. BK434]|uniref:putative baseplate assembly protein n=1 Tax=Tumebacillus sp. BK434 TaxID=2512169 RepID=UPI0010445134|nr:putative baseplate assembly protein [Tumebacillus sp. BK434]TCP59007.1 putative phage baseplate assembly protein [Tumebacillus sp. BK434]
MLPPRIDERTLQDLVARMKEMVPYYTPEWRFSPSDPDAGAALFYMFAEMYLQNVERLNRVPMKNLIAFLNLTGLAQLPASPATGYVTFTLSTGTPQPVLIPTGTALLAAAADGGDAIPFETAAPLLVTPARLVETWLTSTEQDRILRLTPSPEQPALLYDFSGGENLQSHSLYLGHRDLFTATQPAVIELDFYHSAARNLEKSYGEKLADPAALEWSYYGELGWEPFDVVSAKGNRLLLTKNKVRSIVLHELHGIENRWIRCRLKPQMLDKVTSAEQPLLIDALHVKTNYLDANREGGIAPELLFFNDIQVDPAACYPFGEHFAPFALFYVGSQEVFTKRDSVVTMTFRLQAVPHRLLPEEEQKIDWKMVMKESDFDKPKVHETSVLHVIWEYWNGNSWVRLFHHKEYEEIFYRPSEAGVDKVLQFTCPADMADTMVNGHQARWIRARVLQVENLYTNNPVYLSPKIENLRLQYSYFPDAGFPVESCLTQNNMEVADRTSQVWHGQTLFAPFAGLEGTYPAFYMGFDQAPRKGPIQMYFSMKGQPVSRSSELPLIEWEYLRYGPAGPEWAPLKTIDETLGFTRSGTVQFAGPTDFVKSNRFQSELYWIRALNRDGQFERKARAHGPRPHLAGIHLNTTKVIQQESVRREVPKKVHVSDTEAHFHLENRPVFSEEVWVDETGRLNELDLNALLEQDATATEVIRDSGGNILQLWVRYSAVEHFDQSAADDRHYLLDRSSGVLRFGDGVHGKALPNNGPEPVMVHYKKIAGKRGNVEAGRITQLQQSIAFVQEVSNPEPAGGGSDIEPLKATLQRGPQTVRHCDRAITAQDYEWLARQAYHDIAKVKCLPGYNARMERENGCITLAVLGSGGENGRPFFPQLKRKVEEYLAERSANTIAMATRITVIEPVYLEISIFAQLAVTSMDQIVPAELMAVQKLNRFLDPYTGNYDGKGWEIGQQIHASVFYGLLKAVPGVNHVKKLSLTVHKVEDRTRTELTLEEAIRIQHGIVINGKHQIEMDLL